MKSGWSKRSFLDVFADVSRGNVKTLQSEYLSQGSYPVVDQGKSLVGGYVNDPSRLCHAALPAIVFGDHTRVFKYIDFSFCMGADGVKVLRPQIDSDVRYLYYYLRSLPLTDGGYDRHFKYLKRAEITLPPLPEQRRIADILDQADALRAKRRAALAVLETLKQSVFLDMFGDPARNTKHWPMSPIETLCSISGEYGANVASRPYDLALPRYIRITDLIDGGELKPEKVAPSGPRTSWEKYALSPGDILFARSGATVGKTYLHHARNGNSVFAGYLIRFRPDQKLVHPEFLFQFTQTAAYREWVRARQRVVAQPNINAKQYGQELVIPVPPTHLQSDFASFLDAIRPIHEKVLASGADLGAMFSSLQHRAFRGEL